MKGNLKVRYERGMLKRGRMGIGYGVGCIGNGERSWYEGGWSLAGCWWFWVQGGGWWLFGIRAGWFLAAGGGWVRRCICWGVSLFAQRFLAQDSSVWSAAITSEAHTCGGP